MTQSPYVYDQQALLARLTPLLWAQLPEKGSAWLQQQQAKAQSAAGFRQWNLVFAALPRFTGRQMIRLTADELAGISALAPGFTPRNWPAHRLARAWWLLQWPAAQEDTYVRSISALFQTGSMEELTALYSCLPLLAWPEHWVAQTAEGIRSNIGDVLEAIMLHNPYPARYLPEAAWNQLVLKAFFTAKPVQDITGLQERNNLELQQMLRDYAAERTAAGRTVDPQLELLAAQALM
ncbi:MAG TPA: EboA domain-containing protein [Chitinophaga sp.]